MIDAPCARGVAEVRQPMRGRGEADTLPLQRNANEHAMFKFILITVPVLLGLMWIATHLPRLGIAIGGLLVLSPAWLFLLGAFDAAHYRSDGSAAGLVIGLVMLAVLAALIIMGINLIRTGLDNL